MQLCAHQWGCCWKLNETHSPRMKKKKKTISKRKREENITGQRGSNVYLGKIRFPYPSSQLLAIDPKRSLAVMNILFFPFTLSCSSAGCGGEKGKKRKMTSMRRGIGWRVRAFSFVIPSRDDQWLTDAQLRLFRSSYSPTLDKIMRLLFTRWNIPRQEEKNKNKWFCSRHATYY